MTRCTTYVLVAAMAVSGAGMSLFAADTTPPFNTANNGTQLQATGGQMADQSETKAVRNELAKVVDKAVNPGDFSKLSGYLAKSDESRFKDVKSDNNDALDNAIKQFRNDFKAKYNQDFDISGDHLKNAMVYAGQDKNSATVSIARPSGTSDSDMNGNSKGTAGNANTSGTTGATADRTLNTAGNENTVSNRSGAMSGSDTTASTAGNRTGPASNGQNSNSTVRGNDTTATPGVVTNNDNGMATKDHTTEGSMAANNAAAPSNNMNSMASMGMSGTTLNLVNEGHVMNAWRISAPQLSPDQLRQNLTKHIQMLDDQKAAWPSDVNQAYEATAYHVLSAFSDNAVATER